MVYKFKENRVWRSYTGGKRIDSFYGKEDCVDSRMPEEWIASTIEAFNPDRSIKGEGLSFCEDGRLFKDILDENLEQILGKLLSEKYGGKFSILVKLLDSAERLVIQCHPTVSFAKENFGSVFGKTECWYMLDCEENACVYLGFKPGITKEKWKALFDSQDIQSMLDCLHKFNVKKGDLWFVAGGVPHAIGGGSLMIELQEPSDLMVIPERVTPAGIELAEQKLHGGLGYEKMFDCFVYEGLPAEETKLKYYRKTSYASNKFTEIVDESLTDRFSMKALSVEDSVIVNLKERYAIVIVEEGNGSVVADGKTIELKQSDSFLVTANSGELNFCGNMKMVFCIA